MNKAKVRSDFLEKYWAKPADALLNELDVEAKLGLSEGEVSRYRELFGSNTIEDQGPTSLWALLWESVKSPMILVLFAVAGISIVLGQYREAIVMAVVVVIYIAVHLLNKARSDRTMAKLREIQTPKTIVLREGKQIEIDLQKVVVGDILPLRPGSQVPADARLITSAGLLVNEATLTGESAPVQKDAHASIVPDADLAERLTAIFAGTTVLDGQAKAIVTFIGDQTELGQVAELATQQDQEQTPLQNEMDDLATTLAYVAVGVSLLIPLIGLLVGFDFEQMVLTWLSLTFLMVPGQPPIIIAMALALAALELARKQVIVRRLAGAETLGSVNVVMSDKTGTMTENKMRLSEILLPGGNILSLDTEDKESLRRQFEFLQMALLAIPETTNNPTDLALLKAAEAIDGFDSLPSGELINLEGFSQGGEYRCLTYIQDGIKRQYITGRPEVILDLSDSKQSSVDSVNEWQSDERKKLSQLFVDFASQGERITAYATHVGDIDGDKPEGFSFVGAAVINDPIRPEMKEAINTLSTAGVRTVMITGDIRETALYVANQVGIDVEQVAVGSELDGLTDDDYENLVQECSVFARTTPEHKLKLVHAFRRLEKTVAVTGDGINDAPALNAAHIGVSMGMTGTDVARAASDLVLTDDNFAHLTDGVAIGRKAYDNFCKGITYYLSAKAILLSIFIIPLIFGLPFPLAPIQIIFTELLMDLASSTIFISEAAEPDVMFREPRKRKKFLSWTVGKRVFRNMVGLFLGILVVYFGSLALGHPVESARTAAFSTWLLGHIMLAMILKQEQTPLFKQGLFSNKFAIGWLIGMIGFVLAMSFWPFFRSVLNTTSLSLVQWVMVVAVAVLSNSWIEVKKWRSYVKPA